MQSSKLISILKSLDEVEFKMFHKFVRSTYFTTSEDVVRLYDYLRKYYPDFESKGVQKATAFKKLFPKENYSDIKLRNLMRKLTRVGEDYLLHLETKQDEFLRRRRLTEIYGQRNVYHLFKKGTMDLQEELKAKPYRDASFYYENFTLQKEFFSHTNTVKDSKSAIYLENSIENLNQYYLIEHLRLGSAMKSREGIFSKKYDFNLLPNLDEGHSENVLANLLSKVIQLSNSNAETTYFELKKAFTKQLNFLQKKDGQQILLFLLNYAIRQTAKDESRFFREMFFLYKLGLKHSLLFQNEKLSNFTFLNIVITGSRLKEFDWTDTFIKTYKRYLDVSSESDTLALGRSYWHFHKGDYQKVISLIFSHEFDQMLTQINAKVLSIRSYFELLRKDESYLELIISTIEAFEKFIRRKGVLNKQRRAAFLNFTIILKKIIRFTVNPNKKEKEYLDLTGMFQIQKNIIAKSWLSDKIEELEKKKPG